MHSSKQSLNALVHYAMSGLMTPLQLKSMMEGSIRNSEIPQRAIDFVHAYPFELLQEEYKKQNCRWITFFDEVYPDRLKEIYQPPMVLFYQGDLELLHTICLGIVGSRMDTGYGKRVLANFLPTLVHEGITTISGLATGIDTAVHIETMKNRGKTIGVIATGLNTSYPSVNQDLQGEIASNHLLLSEYPLHTRAKRYHFPMRNRIIAGLSHGLLVVEAKQRSGSLITANLALQENREVFAVPGSIFDPGSRGTNELIQAGAKAVLRAEDVCVELPQRVEIL